MTLLEAAILGLVEGITEYLPVSSTGHLILAAALLDLDEPGIKASVDAFNIVIQGGAILAVLGLYRARVLQMLRGLVGKDRVGLALAINIVVAFLPAAVLGFLLDAYIEQYLFYTAPVLAALMLGGVYMIILDRTHVRPSKPPRRPRIDITDLSVGQALIIGLLQTLAMIPGTSRSMMTITGGVLVGLKPKDAAEFSFLLGLPTLGGACVYKLIRNLTDSADAGVPNMFEALGWGPILVGIAVATVSAALAVRWLVGFLNSNGLAVFGVYRILLALVLGAAVLGGVLTIGGSEDAPASGVEINTPETSIEPATPAEDTRTP